MASKHRTAPGTISYVQSPAHVSDEATAACAAFSVLPSPAPRPQPMVTRPGRALLDRIRASQTVLLTGASGAGKSSLLRGIEDALRNDTTTRPRFAPPVLRNDQLATSVFDLLRGPGEDRASSLAQAGLAEPRLWLRAAGCVSVGEQARLRLAMTLHEAKQGDVVIADEFASSIDRACAYALCATVRRWTTRKGVTFIGASAHEDLEGMLAPDLVIETPSTHPRPARGLDKQAITIEEGTLDDYAALAHLHYRGGCPAVVVKILRAMRTVPRHVHPSRQLLAGVVLVSMPTLNARWRDRVWPGFFTTGSKPLNARRLNANLRTLTRAIVEPRSRGLGVASALVRAYLADPLTPGTEALAAMGSVCPFFERGGMTPYDMPSTPEDLRLLDALTHLGLTPAQLHTARIEAGSLLARELSTWGKVCKLVGPGRPAIETIRRLTPIAACRLCSRPRAYAHVTQEGLSDDRSTE